MYNIEKLESQWLQYRRKKIIWPAGIALLTISVVSTGTYLYSTKHTRLPDKKIVSVPIASSVPVQAAANNSAPMKKVEVVKVETDPEESLAIEVPSLVPVVVSKPANTRPKVGQIIFQDTPVKHEVRKKTRKRKNMLIQISKPGGRHIAQDVENRFEFAKDKSDSLFLAKYYYDKMKYAKAEKWALETNKLDSSIEESWLIFAKSLAKQGKRIESLRVLKAFMGHRNSMKARVLMDKIRRGKKI